MAVLLVLTSQRADANWLCTGNLPTSPAANGQPCSDNATAQLNFGTVVKPSSGNGTVAVTRSGSISTANTTLSVVDSNGVLGGKSKIRGTDNSQITIDFVGSSAGGITIKDFTARYQGNNFTDTGASGGDSGPFSARARGRNLTYGATLEISSSATVGSYSVPYEIHVKYDGCAACVTAIVARTALVEIFQPMEISLGDEMDFGSVLKPTTANSNVRLSTDGVLSVASGDATLLSGTTGVTAKFDITWQQGQTISVDADFVSATSPGLTLRRFRGKYNGLERNINDVRTFTLISGTNTLFVGADVRINRNSVQSGSQSMDYLVTIGYD